MIEIKETDIIAAVETGGHKAFLELFFEEYRKVFADGYTAEAMQSLSFDQHVVHAYDLLIRELDEEGFVGMAQNGYTPYFFGNPFARKFKEFGLVKTGKLMYKAQDIYEANKKDLERDKDEEEFVASFEKYEAFDPIEEEILELQDSEMEKLASYVDEHIEDFAHIIK